MNSLISVLLPLYEAAATLAACLESILAQTDQNFEILAVDDGSTDDSLSILREFAARDSRLKILTLESNQGIVPALNLGLEACKGTWIARMDADDLMRPERLRLQRKFAADNPQTELIGGLVRVFKDQGELTAGQTLYQNWSNSLLTHDQIRKEIFVESPVMHPTFFLKKSLYQQLGAYLEQPWAEDYDFLLRAFLQNIKMAKVEQVLVDKRDSPTRLTRVDNRYKKRAMFRAKAHYLIKTGWSDKKEGLIIIGSGDSGRHSLEALRSAGRDVLEFFDQKPDDPNRRVKGVPTRLLNPTNAKELLTKQKNCYYILCIGDKKGREQIGSWLTACGLRPQQDYIRFV